MSLKADRYEGATDISYFMNQVVNRGVIVVHGTSGSGAAMDQALATVGTPSGLGLSTVSGTYPAGLLLNDMVNLDLTRQHGNAHKDEMQYGGKVTLLKHGFVVTNNVVGTPTAGQVAYYDVNGNVTATPTADTSNGVTFAPKVGRFMGKVDADGYIKVEINLP